MVIKRNLKKHPCDTPSTIVELTKNRWVREIYKVTLSFYNKIEYLKVFVNANNGNLIVTAHKIQIQDIQLI